MGGTNALGQYPLGYNSMHRPTGPKTNFQKNNKPNRLENMLPSEFVNYAASAP